VERRRAAVRSGSLEGVSVCRRPCRTQGSWWCDREHLRGVGGWPAAEAPLEARPDARHVVVIPGRLKPPRVCGQVVVAFVVANQMPSARRPLGIGRALALGGPSREPSSSSRPGVTGRPPEVTAGSNARRNVQHATTPRGRLSWSARDIPPTDDTERRATDQLAEREGFRSRFLFGMNGLVTGLARRTTGSNRGSNG
jgi:hypothetical protein